MPAALTLDRVTKRFGDRTVVSELSLDVPAGSIYGFIGPNGSGKTTTIRMIMNLIAPDTGAIMVLGQTHRSSIRDRVGYLPEERGLYKRMTVRQVLRYYGGLKGQPAETLRPHIAAWAERLSLTAWLDKPVHALSKGMAQRVQFIATVIARPALLILDEPLSGLDPVSADVLVEAIRGLRRDGVTIVLSTHDMTAAERLCDAVLMILNGRKVLDGPLNAVRRTFGEDVIRLKTAAGPAALAGFPEVSVLADHGDYQDVRVAGDPQAFLTTLATRTQILRFEVTTPTLHDIFLRLASGSAPTTEARAL